MSRIHDALRKAGQESSAPRGSSARRTSGLPVEPPPPPGDELMGETSPPVYTTSTALAEPPDLDDLEDVLASAREIAYHPQNDALIVNPTRPREAPAEEFRTLRTRPESPANATTAAYAGGYQRFSRRRQVFYCGQSRNYPGPIG